jgi:hypothetical protein
MVLHGLECCAVRLVMHESCLLDRVTCVPLGPARQSSLCHLNARQLLQKYTRRYRTHIVAKDVCRVDDVVVALSMIESQLN